MSNETNTGVKLNDLLGKVTPQDLAQKWRSLIGGAEGKDRDFAGFLTEAASESVAQALNKALDKDLLEIVASSLVMVKDLQKYLDPKEFPPEKETEHRLLKHTLQAPQDLDVSVLLAGLPTSIKVVLTIDLDIEFETLILVIRAGRLRAIDLGTATVRTRLRYRNVKLIEPQPSAPLAFSRWPLPGEGLAIG